MNLVVQGQRLTRFAVDRPRGFVKLLHRYMAIALACADARDLLGKLTHHVAACNPHGQRYELIFCGLLNGERHAIQMGVQVGCFDAVVHGAQVAAAPSKQHKVDTTVKRKRMVIQSRRPASGQVFRSTK